MRVVAVTIAFGLLSSHLRASSPLSKCFDGDSDTLFTITSPMPLESRMPAIESDSGGRAAKLIWSPAPADVSMTMEQIGRCRDKRIYRVTYQKHSDTPEARPQLVCMMFGYQDASREGIRIRPFFVTADEEIDSIESYFASTSTYPFALEIHKNFKGNGVYWTTWMPNGEALTRMMLAAGFARAEYKGDFRLRSAAGKHNFDTPHGVVHGWVT